MDIQGLGEAVVEELFAKKLVADMADLYRVRKDQLLRMAGFKEKKADNLLKSIEESRTRSLSRFLLGLGIRDVGEKGARLLAEQFGSIDKLTEANAEELQRIHDVGPVMAESVANYFRHPTVRRLINKFSQMGICLLYTSRCV